MQHLELRRVDEEDLGLSDQPWQKPATQRFQKALQRSHLAVQRGRVILSTLRNRWTKKHCASRSHLRDEFPPTVDTVLVGPSHHQRDRFVLRFSHGSPPSQLQRQPSSLRILVYFSVLAFSITGVSFATTEGEIPHSKAVFSAPGCPVLHRIALPVVSEWYQKATGDASRPLANERSFFFFARGRVGRTEGLLLVGLYGAYIVVHVALG